MAWQHLTVWPLGFCGRREGRGRERRHHREVVEAHGVTASLWGVLLTRTLPVQAFPVQPEHVATAPVAHNRRHASCKCCIQFGHGSVSTDAKPQMASRLAKGHLHGFQHARNIIHREINGDRKGHIGVNAPRARAKLLGRPLPGPVPVGTPAAVAFAQATVVLGTMQGGLEGEAVALLDVNLSAGLTANAVGITVVVPTIGRPLVLAHGGEV
mmetsp:Transcript_32753/g.77958  ORF Transcript_32753/g.77958 Transcript_32753/m.77958 type:complete len:212 (-) Transcript_32753:415-1050(-)